MENLPPSSLSLFEKFNNWIKESATIKLASIGFLVLVLLIPQTWIQSLITERQSRADEVIREIASRWSGNQNVTGPILVIPFTTREKIDKGKDGIEILESRSEAFFLPQELNITGTVHPTVLHRGIFESAVYESSIGMKANFSFPDFAKLSIAPADILWKESYYVLGISDLRGIAEDPSISTSAGKLTGEPSKAMNIGAPVNINNVPSPETGIVIRLPWQGPADFTAAVTVNLSLKGSESLHFSPIGQTTDVQLSGPWTDPGFDGEYLPSERVINDKGFSAHWKILHYNRPFKQHWITGHQDISGSDFGARFLIPVDQYQKSIRTAKYGVLVILLTFVALFMIEITRKIRIHPVQYILVGSALIVYYVLLLSLSEQLGYNLAYAIATTATIALVTAYSFSFLGTRVTSAMFAAWMTLFYGFIFVIIQEQDYSLLIGSLGLFVIISMIMYFSRKVKWYGE